MGSTVLVTGAAGFVASHCIQLLLQLGYRVKGTVRSLKNNYKVQELRQIFPNAKYQLDLIEADLTNDDDWTPIVKGCTYVLHIASAVTFDQQVSEEEIIRPVIEGTLKVLRGCEHAGGVRRVVLTSSLVAINGAWECRDVPWNESDWTNTTTDALPPYYKGKTLAEKAAWDFMEALPCDKKFELTSVNPGLIMGPPLINAESAASETIVMLMENRLGFIPKIGISLIDVRDVALSHVRAMLEPKAKGHRHILVGHRLWLEDIAALLREEFEAKDYVIPSEVKTFDIPGAPKCDVIPLYDSSRLRNILKVEPREAKQTIIDMAERMIEVGQIRRILYTAGVNEQMIA